MPNWGNLGLKGETWCGEEIERGVRTVHRVLNAISEVLVFTLRVASSSSTGSAVLSSPGEKY